MNYKKIYLIQTNYTEYNVKIIYDFILDTKEHINDFEHSGIYFKCCELLFGNDKYFTSICLRSNDIYARILSLKYNNNIDIKVHLESDKSGIKHLLDTAMNLTMLMFPNIKTFLLSDNSNKSCYRISKWNKRYNTVDLGLYYLVFYKTTWYEKVFKMKLDDSNTQIKLDKLLNTMVCPIEKQNYDLYDMLENYIDSDILQKYQDLYNIKEIHDKSIHFHDFFKTLKSTINNETELCLFLTYFIAKFMSDITCGDIPMLISNTRTLDVIDVDKVYIKYPLLELSEINEKYNNVSFNGLYILNPDYTDMIRLTCTTDYIHHDSCRICYN